MITREITKLLKQQPEVDSPSLIKHRIFPKISGVFDAPEKYGRKKARMK